MTRTIALFALVTALGGCGPELPESPGPEALAGATAPLDAEPASDGDAVRRDVRGTRESIARIARQIEALDSDTRARAAESLRILSVNCPYTRTALQLPFALEQVVEGIDAAQLDPFVRDDWETLREGLRAHVGVLEALGVDLALPAPGDALYGSPPGALIDRATLLAAADPLLATAPLIDATTPLAERIPPAAVALIDHHSDRMVALTGVLRPCPRGPWAVLPGEPWTLGMQLGGWHDALRRVEPFARDAEAKVAIAATIDLLDAAGEAAFASRAAQGP